MICNGEGQGGVQVRVRMVCYERERHVNQQHVQRAGLSTSERIFHNDERSESSAPSGIGLETTHWNYTQLQLYITKGERAPLDNRGGNVEKRNVSFIICMACTCACVCVREKDTSPLFWLWSCDFVRAEAESRRWENGNLPPEGCAHTQGFWLLAYSCLNENLWSKTVWKIFCPLNSLGVALERVYVWVCSHMHNWK